jgi:hypothetical protein
MNTDPTSDVRATPVFNYERLKTIAEQRKEEFSSADPFPHAVIDDFLPSAIAEQVLAEFPAPDKNWIHYSHFNEKKLGLKPLQREEVGAHGNRTHGADYPIGILRDVVESIRRVRGKAYQHS